ncbi:hypothetical protein EMIHUDRAFT_447579 [Emiliania huxleyi CCMP1516]|uniref:Anaphase-promoting complex subunit 4 WD40 domain-containing protein n=2 Tax=Emiliania huxleyi TaxID=2903 RepID=A0A0D3L247_EMIH1|nr:hypothetical protein EMIHUDRAFT_447579 [Emiliania huxleyi CCMP1516]EOD42082.1 hypothetical protein EMIHUDRAFT_447579 [Emiliania huxleyi CCMP1516]|eukprot:XP_005794511.1 hypothetical protein EMIHUDRAFT_447579 [Emiliania huxleyi CCMP1516]
MERDGSETEDPWAAAAAAAHAMAMAAQTLARAGLEICVATARIALLCAGEMLTAAWVWAATMAQRAQREASQMSEAGAAALAERVSEIASHPDAVPCSGMFAATFLTLCFCRAVSVTAVPHILLAAVAAAIAVPSTAAVAVDIAARASDLVSTALRHPQLEAAAASVAEALQHPHAERATAMLGAAHNSSAALAARAYAAALSHPHLQPLLEAAIAHPHVAATRNHAHWGRLAGWLGPLCLGAMLLGLLRCTVCSSCRRRGGTESAAPACSAAATAAAAEAKAAKRERQRAKREAAAKLAAKRKKRGGVVTGEGELRLEDEPASSRIRLASGPEAARPKKRPTPPPLSHPRLLCTLKGFSEGVTGAALSQDGALAAAVSSDRTLRVFSGLRQAGSGDPQRAPLPTPLIANVHLDFGTACSISASGRNVLVATAAGRRLLAYSLSPKLQLRREFDAAAVHPAPLSAAILAPNSQYIVTVGSEGDRSVCLWSLSGSLVARETAKQAAVLGAQVFCVGGHSRGVTAASFAQDCVHLAVAARDAEWSVVRTDLRHAEPAEVGRGKAPHGTPFERVALSPFAKRLVGATATGTSIVDVGRGVTLETIPHGHGPSPPTALQYSNDALRVLSAGVDGKLRLWRVEDDDAKAGAL